MSDDPRVWYPVALVDAFKRELTAVATVGGSALQQLHQNVSGGTPAPDAAPSDGETTGVIPSNLRSLPEYDFCAEQVASETYTRLERFIYDNEPAGTEDAKEFRNGLLAVLNEAHGNWEAEPSETRTPHPTAVAFRELADAHEAQGFNDMIAFTPTALRRFADQIDACNAVKSSADSLEHPHADIVVPTITTDSTSAPAAAPHNPNEPCAPLLDGSEVAGAGPIWRRP